MKYHEKLNLKSPIYKYSNNNTSRTPTKSPIKPPVNPIEMFQKVCCPNCKYAFKIIKQQVLKQNPLEMTTPSIKKSIIKQIKQKLSVEVQTQNDLIITINNSPTKSSKSPLRISRMNGLSPSRNLQSYKKDKLNEILHTQNTGSKTMREPQFKFKPLCMSPFDKTVKSKNLLRTLDTKNYKNLSSQSLQVPKSYHENNYTDVESTSQNNFAMSMNDQVQSRIRTNQNYLESPKKSSQKFSQSNRKNSHRQEFLDQPLDEENVNRNRSMTGTQNAVIKQSDFIKKENKQQIDLNQNLENKNCCRCKDDSEFSSFIVETVIKNDKNQKIMRQLQQFCKIALQQVQVPSFCKMLALSQ